MATSADISKTSALTGVAGKLLAVASGLSYDRAAERSPQGSPLAPTSQAVKQDVLAPRPATFVLPCRSSSQG